jgi:hypothetical protein
LFDVSREPRYNGYDSLHASELTEHSPGLTHVEALLLTVLRDWRGAQSASNLADRRRLLGVQVSAIRLTADRKRAR